MKPDIFTPRPVLTKAGAQREAQKVIIGRHGIAAFREFLRTPQPAFDEMTGRQLLDERPFELLAKLQSEGGANENEA